MPASNPSIEAAFSEYQSRLQNDTSNKPVASRIAEEFGIHPSSLTRRLNGQRRPRNQAFSHLQALTPTEESTLVDYIRRMTETGNPIEARFVVHLAEDLQANRMKGNGTYNQLFRPLGHNWVHSFKNRHEELRTVWSKEIEVARVRGTERERLERWFMEISRLRATHLYDLDDIWNMDETGFGVGSGTKTKVFIVVDKEYPERSRTAGYRAGTTKQGTERVTAVECVSASGRAINPLIVYKSNKPFDPREHPLNPLAKDWVFATARNGYTTNVLGLKWLEEVFLPQTQPSRQGARRLLILDGHGSHVRYEFVGLCMRNDIDLMILPAHSSAITQPLDVSVFGPYKTFLGQETSNHYRWSQNSVLPRRQWIELLIRARVSSLTPRNIKAGWKKAGLQPVCPIEVYRQLQPQPEPSTPPRTTRALSRTPLGSLELENEQLFLAQSQAETPVKTPVKNRLAEMTRLLEEERARATVLEAELLKYQASNRPVRVGNTANYLGTHEFTRPDIYEQLKQRQTASDARATEKRRRDEERQLLDLNSKRARREEAARTEIRPLATILNA